MPPRLFFLDACHDVRVTATVALVRSDTDVTATSTAAIQFDVARHAELFAAIGCDTVEKIAAETGVTERTVYRARQGVVGRVFMANTIAALHRHAATLRKAGHKPPTLDELFSVVIRTA